MIDWIYSHYNEKTGSVYLLGNYQNTWAYLSFQLSEPMNDSLLERVTKFSEEDMITFLNMIIVVKSDEHHVKFAEEALKIIKLGGSYYGTSDKN
jgi:hypothetical protein